VSNDLRVPLAPILEAFGLPAIVTRPAPDDTPIETTGVWVAFTDDEAPTGLAIRRNELRRILVLPRSDVPTVPHGTTIAAAEVQGGEVFDWRADGTDRVDEDSIRVIVVRVPEGAS